MSQDYNATIHLPKTDFPMRAGLPKREPEMLRNWKKLDVYGELLKKNAGKPRFSLHDGPPFSNGNLHMGHALNKSIKDIIIRSHAMRGYYTPYIPGWDNHGMPIESAIIKQNKLNRKKMPVTEFRSACHEFAQHYVEVQSEGFQRLGAIGDWEHPYLAMNPSFEAEEVKVFGEMYKRGYIYKGLKPVYWCPHDETALAEAEIEYQDDPCTRFMPKILDENIYDAVDPGLAAKMHKAIAVIQFKVEGAMIKRHPEYEMENRMLLTAVDYKKGTVTIEGKEYPMLDMNFPTIDPRNPLELTRGEKELLRTLCASFRHSEVLQRQVKFIYSHGGIYKCYNSNLLYHGCIPMTKDGAFDTIMIGGNGYKGKSLMDFLNRQVHNAYFLPDGADGKEEALDLMWYLWCGARSPVFGKSKMTTFEHYFVEDKATHKEVMNPYYKLCEKVEICDKILEEFGLKTEGSHIINGHVPVKLKDGEKPVKAGGKLFVIDGGLSKAYQSTTGIAGYTLIYNSHHLALAEHMPFDPKKDSTPKVSVVEKLKVRIMVADTDKGRELKEQIADLKELVAAYREGVIKERAE